MHGCPVKEGMGRDPTDTFFSAKVARHILPRRVGFRPRMGGWTSRSGSSFMDGDYEPFIAEAQVGYPAYDLPRGLNARLRS